MTPPPPRPQVALSLLDADLILSAASRELERRTEHALSLMNQRGASTDDRAKAATKAAHLAEAIKNLAVVVREGKTCWRKEVHGWRHETQPWRFPRERCAECNPEAN